LFGVVFIIIDCWLLQVPLLSVMCLAGCNQEGVVRFQCNLRCLPPTKDEVHVFARVCLPVYLSVCLSVSWQDYSKTRWWIWMKYCVSTDVGTWTNWLTFEPDPDHSLDAGTGLLSPISYRLQNFAALPRLPATALLRGILRRQNSTFMYWPLERAVVLKWFYSLSRQKTFVGGKCALPSALLVYWCYGLVVRNIKLPHNTPWFL